MNTEILENKRILQTQVAMTVALVSWAMLFATLFLGYALFRFNAPTWPPSELKEIRLLTPALSTLFIAFSSLAYFFFEAKILNKTKTIKDLALARVSVFMTFLTGFSFLFLQTLFWNELKEKNIFASAGVFPSILYTFTWVHAAHIILGLIALLWVVPLVVKRERFEQNAWTYSSRVQSVGKFWHFLGIIWLIMFVTLFLI